MRLTTALLAVLITLAIGCSSTQPAPSNLTPGMAKKVIMKGQTTQAEVVEVFGPPDLVTHRDDIQVWTWDKIRYDMRQSSDFLALIIVGGQSRSTRSSSTSTMLIVYFGGDDVVKDYRMVTSRF